MKISENFGQIYPCLGIAVKANSLGSTGLVSNRYSHTWK